LEDWFERTTSKKNKVVLHEEGRGKISSLHFVKILGTKSLPKWGGMIQIQSLYYLSSISMPLEWKTLEESACKAILVAGTSLEYWGLELSEAI
jgi:hypothetical protein